MQACGFQVVMEDAGESDQADAYAVLPDDDDLLQMNAALVLLGYRHPKPLGLHQKSSVIKSAGISVQNLIWSS